jgi:hypothetical protein
MPTPGGSVSTESWLVIIAVLFVGLLLAGLIYLLYLFPADARGGLKNEIALLLGALGGVTPVVDPTVLKQLHGQAEFAKMLGWIKNSMHLDLRVGLRIVDTGNATTPMWIETPRSMPPYGSQEFRNTRVIVNVRREALDRYPFDWIVAGFAHELSHVVLFSIGHALQKSERAVDLTAMILGYRDFIARTDRTEVQGGAAAVLLSVVLLPLGLLFIPGHKKSSLGYLSKGEKRFARRHLSAIEKSSIERARSARATG